MNDAQLELQAILGEDEDNIKILTCMLKASADAYEIYKTKGISDKIYFDTMKCYTRFINETYKMTGIGGLLAKLDVICLESVNWNMR